MTAANNDHDNNKNDKSKNKRNRPNQRFQKIGQDSFNNRHFNNRTFNTKSNKPPSGFQVDPSHNGKVVDMHTSLYHSDHSQTPILTKQRENELINYNNMTYLLSVFGFFSVGIFLVVAVAMNYYMRAKAEDSWLATHFDWQIKTFWYSLIFWAVGWALMILGLGGLGIGVFADSSKMALGSTGFLILSGVILLFTFFWHIYRIARGWIALMGRRPVP